ncbi:MAG: PLDc N-terminal domain-containing protein [Phycisphaerae bacterium]|nr:PLDc N-terminal domain-containing protein [Phycisphaerae bacterium]
MVTILWSVLTYLLLIGGFLLGIVLIAHILLQKRAPSGTIAWLLIIFFLPWVGVPLYLFFGGRKMARHVEKKGRLDLEPASAIGEEDATVIDRILRSYTIPGAETGHRVRLCGTGIERFDAMVSLLESATRSIFLSTFIYHDDAVGRHILDILVAKAKAGVEVKLLMDGVGTLHTRGWFFSPLVEAGGKFAFFLPVLHRPFRGRTNLRNHRKMTIVDNRTVIGGGANIGNEYMGPQPYEKRWKDLAFTLQGPTVRHWLNVFARDWAFGAKETLSPEQLQIPEPLPSADASHTGIVQLVPSGPDVPSDALHDALLSMIYMARKRFWTMTPYFVPDDALCQALLLAARRGVDVRVILPRRSNHPLPDIVRGNPLRQIQDAGGMVMFYAPQMLHSKVVLMDEQAAVLGSANMDIRSLLLNYETAMFVYSADEIAAVEHYMENIMAECACGIGQASLFRALGESVVRLVSPLL